MPYLIITVCDRELESVETAETMDEAVVAANENLKGHCVLIGHEDEYEQACRSGSDRIRLAGPGNTNAWCNLGDYHWDSYITQAPAPGEPVVMVTASE